MSATSTLRSSDVATIEVPAASNRTESAEALNLIGSGYACGAAGLERSMSRTGPVTVATAAVRPSGLKDAHAIPPPASNLETTRGADNVVASMTVRLLPSVAPVIARPDFSL